MKKVLVFGTFDVLHPGHLALFKEARRYGDHLTVVVARDSTVRETKGKEAMYDEDDRLEHVRQIRLVDNAILGNEDDKYKIINEIKPDVICLGYDQTTFTEKLDKKLAQMKINAKIVRLKPYKQAKYKSSLMKI